MAKIQLMSEWLKTSTWSFLIWKRSNIILRGSHSIQSPNGVDSVPFFSVRLPCSMGIQMIDESRGMRSRHYGMIWARSSSRAISRRGPAAKTIFKYTFGKKTVLHWTRDGAAEDRASFVDAYFIGGIEKMQRKKFSPAAISRHRCRVRPQLRSCSLFHSIPEEKTRRFPS